MKRNEKKQSLSRCEGRCLGDSMPSDTAKDRSSKRRAQTRLELPTGKPDLEVLRSATREWLVPLLVEKFLREQGVELRAKSKHRFPETPTENHASGHPPINGLECQRIQKTNYRSLG